MKRFLLPLLAALALPTAVEANWFGRYGSYYEAKEACEKWASEGGTYKVRYETFEIGGVRYGAGVHEKNVRECQDEGRTNQVLGFKQIRAKDGGSYDAGYLYEGNANTSRKIIKKFKY